MITNAVHMTCAPYYGQGTGRNTESTLEEGVVGAGTALELFAEMFALRGNVDLKIIALNDDEITFTNEYRLRFGGRTVGKMPCGSNHYWYAYTINHGPTDTDGFGLTLRLIEAIARAYPELCSDEVRDTLDLTRPSVTPH